MEGCEGGWARRYLGVDLGELVEHAGEGAGLGLALGGEGGLGGGEALGGGLVLGLRSQDALVVPDRQLPVLPRLMGLPPRRRWSR